MASRPFTMFDASPRTTRSHVSPQTTRSRAIIPARRFTPDGVKSGDESSFIPSHQTSIPTSADDTEQEQIDRDEVAAFRSPKAGADPHLSFRSSASLFSASPSPIGKVADEDQSPKRLSMRQSPTSAEDTSVQDGVVHTSTPRRQGGTKLTFGGIAHGMKCAMSFETTHQEGNDEDGSQELTFNPNEDADWEAADDVDAQVVDEHDDPGINKDDPDISKGDPDISKGDPHNTKDVSLTGNDDHLYMNDDYNNDDDDYDNDNDNDDRDNDNDNDDHDNDNDDHDNDHDRRDNDHDLHDDVNPDDGDLDEGDDVDFGGTLLNVELNADGRDQFGEIVQDKIAGWNLLCDRMERDDDDLDLPEGMDDGFVGSNTKWTQLPNVLGKCKIKFNWMQRSMLRRADKEFSQVYKNVQRVTEAHHPSFNDIVTYYVGHFVASTHRRLVRAHSARPTLTEADTLVRMEVAMIIYGKSYDVLMSADPDFCGIHPGLEQSFDAARYKYMRWLIGTSDVVGGSYSFDRAQSLWDLDVTNLLKSIAYTRNMNELTVIIDDWKTTINAKKARLHGFSSVKIRGHWHMVIDVMASATTHLVLTLNTRTVGVSCLEAVQLAMCRLTGNPLHSTITNERLIVGIDKGYSAAEVIAYLSSIGAQSFGTKVKTANVAFVVESTGKKVDKSKGQKYIVDAGVDVAYGAKNKSGNIQVLSRRYQRPVTLHASEHNIAADHQSYDYITRISPRDTLWDRMTTTRSTTDEPPEFAALMERAITEEQGQCRAWHVLRKWRITSTAAHFALAPIIQAMDSDDNDVWDENDGDDRGVYDDMATVRAVICTPKSHSSPDDVDDEGMEGKADGNVIKSKSKPEWIELAIEHKPVAYAHDWTPPKTWSREKIVHFLQTETTWEGGKAVSWVTCAMRRLHRCWFASGAQTRAMQVGTKNETRALELVVRLLTSQKQRVRTMIDTVFDDSSSSLHSGFRMGLVRSKEQEFVCASPDGIQPPNHPTPNLPHSRYQKRNPSHMLLVLPILNQQSI